MDTHYYSGAETQALAAPERPTNDDAPAGGAVRGVREQETEGGGDCASIEARKLISTTIARAALLGIEVHELTGGTWLLRNARGGEIGTVRNVDGLSAAISGFEAVRDDVRELVRSTTRGVRSDVALGALKARAACAGFDLQRDGDRFMVTRWGRCRELADAAAVAGFLDQVGASA